jgi:hypothetical protein
VTPSERLAEIAELLARGIQRFLADEIKAAGRSRKSQDRLDVLGQSEASCGSRRTSPQSRTA